MAVGGCQAKTHCIFKWHCCILHWYDIRRMFRMSCGLDISLALISFYACRKKIIHNLRLVHCLADHFPYRSVFQCVLHTFYLSGALRNPHDDRSIRNNLNISINDWITILLMVFTWHRLKSESFLRMIRNCLYEAWICMLCLAKCVDTYFFSYTG